MKTLRDGPSVPGPQLAQHLEILTPQIKLELYAQLECRQLLGELVVVAAPVGMGAGGARAREAWGVTCAGGEERGLGRGDGGGDRGAGGS